MHFLTAADVIAILDASRKNRVSVLKFAGLEVELSQASQDGTLTGPEAQPAAAMAEPNHEKQTEEANLADELQTREDQLAEALLSDPLLAEQLIRDGELTEDSDGADSEDF